MTTDKTGAQVSVADNPEKKRYEISLDDGTVAGFSQYVDRETGGDAPTERVFYHTEVAEEFGGRGLGTILVQEELDDTNNRGMVVVGVCPLVAAFLKKHPDYAEKAHPVTPDILNWLQTAR